MSVVPQYFTGLNTTLSDIWIEKVVILEEEDDSWSFATWAIVIGSSVGGGLILLCCGYYGLIYCANRKHKVSYETAEKKKFQNKMHESEM